MHWMMERVIMTWERIKVGDLGRVVTGKTPKTAEKDNYNGNIMFVTPSDDMDAKYIYSTGKTITEKGMQSVKGAIIPAGAICVSCIGSDLGKVVITTEECVTNQQINSIIIDASRFDTDFIYYSMLILGKELNFHSKTSTAVPIVNKSSFSSYEIKCPPLEEQKKIAGVLSTIDEKRERNERINDNLLQQAIALYEHLLQDAEWPTATILDIAEKIAMGPFGSNIKVSTFVPEGVPIISGNHLRGYFLEEPEFNYITEEHAERLKNSTVYPHDIIFTHAGNIGQVAMIPDGCKYNRYVLSQRQFYLRCNETKVVPEFLLMFFHSASGQHELLSYANQTGVPSIAQPASNLKKIPFKCPPMQEQLKWQEQVHPLLGRYLNNRLENEKLSALRDALLPRLMSGELDVSNLDI